MICVMRLMRFPTVLLFEAAVSLGRHLYRGRSRPSAAPVCRRGKYTDDYTTYLRTERCSYCTDTSAVFQGARADDEDDDGENGENMTMSFQYDI